MCGECRRCPHVVNTDCEATSGADIEIQANEILHHKLTLNGYLAEFTGQSMERITQARPWHGPWRCWVCGALCRGA